MLAGCIPVVTTAGALPELAGEYGVSIAEPMPDIIAQAISDALLFGDESRVLIRQSILDRFPMKKRAQALDELIAPLMDTSH